MSAKTPSFTEPNAVEEHAEMLSHSDEHPMVNLVMGSMVGLGLLFVIWFHWFLVMGSTQPSVTELINVLN